jgi:acyl carrier protein
MGLSDFERLKAYVVERTGVEPDEVTLDARLYNDLGIYGDDAVELLVGYGIFFNVDVTKFMAADYFRGEGDLILPALIRFLTGKRPESGKKVLTIAHLEKGIVAGRLDEEVINENNGLI